MRNQVKVPRGIGPPPRSPGKDKVSIIRDKHGWVISHPAALRSSRWVRYLSIAMHVQLYQPLPPPPHLQHWMQGCFQGFDSRSWRLVLTPVAGGLFVGFLAFLVIWIRKNKVNRKKRKEELAAQGA